jgi:hypothetical protein
MLLVQTFVRDELDIRLTHYKPTFLGKLRGIKERCTIHQFDGKFGGWLINGTFSGSDEIEVQPRQTITIQGVNCGVTIEIEDRRWHMDIKVYVTSAREGIHRQKSFFPPLEIQRKLRGEQRPKLKVA